MTIKKKEITCPHCGKKNTWRVDNIFRPFCSDRCKLIDLGDWADEKHRIPAEPVDPDQIVDAEKPPEENK